MFRFLLQQGEDNSLLTGFLAHHGIAFPMAFIRAESCNFRTLGDTLPIALLILMRLRTLVSLAFHGLRKLRYRQVKITGPDLVIQCMRTYHLTLWKQPMQAGIPYTSIQRPLMLVELSNDPAKKLGTADNAMLSPRTMPVSSVDCFSSLKVLALLAFC